MKKIWNLMLLSIVVTLSFGQNLVPNPSFEDTVQCTGFPQPTINYALHWSSYGGTSDYFNSCASSISSLWGVPNNVVGYQNAYIGHAYSGLLTWFINAGSPIREYMGIQLNQSLIIGSKYFVSCYISNGDSVNCNSSSNKFGLKFSTVPFTNSIQSFQVLMNNVAHIYTDSVIKDKINWTRVSSSFISDSSYQYLIIGNFYDDAHTVVDTVPPIGIAGAYYYIDAVCVTMDSVYDSTWTLVRDVSHELNNEIFPNPSNDYLIIENKLDAKSFMICDLFGQAIRSGQLIKGRNKIVTSKIAAGMYWVFLDRKYFKKIIVQY